LELIVFSLTDALKDLNDKAVKPVVGFVKSVDFLHYFFFDSLYDRNLAIYSHRVKFVSEEFICRHFEIN
jgi:hypothetical protein